ncbi:MAG: Hsp20/alpha crystallin family protein [Spirochaetota bacterium]|nr:Hsp20/alpha crystallin family protein [Spirochaetota bacterium]
MKWDLIKRNREKNELSPLTSLREEINSLFNNFFRDSHSNLFDSNFSPSVDVKEDEKAIYVEAELPGMDEKDINIELKDNVLTLKGEKKEETESKDKGEYRLERRYGSFERSFNLPADVLVDKIKASYKKGILKIELPKDETKTSKKLKIKID